MLGKGCHVLECAVNNRNVLYVVRSKESVQVFQSNTFLYPMNLHLAVETFQKPKPT